MVGMKSRYLSGLLLVSVGCSGEVDQTGEQVGSTEQHIERPADSALAPEGHPHFGLPSLDAREARAEGVTELAPSALAAPNGERLREFAAKCDLATGISVPDFQCASGTEVPVTRLGVPIDTVPADGLCDRPNRLNKVCDPGSRGQIVAKTTDAVAFAHCRRAGLSGNNYSDIAVIQYNQVNGAVCFYQIELGSHDGNIKAPSRGTSNTAAPQIDPAGSDWRTVNQQRSCFRCHDNGALIRSPYITQLSFFPGRGSENYNLTAPMRFVGDDFQDIVLSRVQVADTACNNCHRMGMSNLGSGGTARDLGLRATATMEESKMPHSATSPIWMMPPLKVYNEGVAAMAQIIAKCANEPASTPGCSITPYSTTWSGMSPGVLAALL
jgi:hypothetical protein